jgi:hypothetical protein
VLFYNHTILLKGTCVRVQKKKHSVKKNLFEDDSRVRLGSKGLCDHPYKKNQKAPKTPSKGPFFDILYGRL